MNDPKKQFQQGDTGQKGGQSTRSDTNNMQDLKSEDQVEKLEQESE